MILSGIVVLVVLIGAYFLLRPGRDSCEYKTSLEYSDAAVMGQVLRPGVSYDWRPNHYHCQKPQKGDLTVYQLGQNPERYVRVIAAAEGDVISIVNDPRKQGYNLLVNGLRYGSPAGPFWFGITGVRPTIALYLGADGTRTLGAGEVIVMGLGSPGFNDSGLFGVMSASSMQGIVTLPSEEKAELDKSLSWEKPKDEEAKPAAEVAPKIGNPAVGKGSLTKQKKSEKPKNR